MGRVHHCDDDTNRAGHGNWIAHGKSKRDGRHDLRFTGSGLWRMGRTIPRAFSRN